MSDNMEHIADFFKESGHRDRHFEVDEAGWDRLAAVLDQEKKRRWLPFWWSLGVFLLGGASLGLWLTGTADVPRTTATFGEIEAEPTMENPSLNQTEQQFNLTTAELDGEIITHAEGTSGTTQETASTTGSTAPILIGKSETVTTDSRKKITLAVSTAESAAKLASQKESFDAELGGGEKIPEAMAEQAPTFRKAPITSPEALLDTGAAQLSTTQLRSMTTASVVNSTGSKKKQSSRRPYPRPKAQQRAASPMTTMQTMLGAPVYGSTILGEEINAWEREKVGGRWQVALGVGTIPASYQGVLFPYSTEEIVGAFVTSYTMADGGVVDLYVDGSTIARGKVAQNFNFYRFALYRDLGKGFGLKGSLLVATINDKTPSSLINQVPNRPDLAYFTYNSRSTNLMAELGLQYTFYRRQRFQPFLGLSVFNVMSSSFRSEQRFVWPSMGIDEVSSSSSISSSTSFPGYYFEFGMQYLPAPDWSIGPSFIITGAPFLEPQFGLGLEARYRW